MCSKTYTQPPIFARRGCTARSYQRYLCCGKVGPRMSLTITPSEPGEQLRREPRLGPNPLRAVDKGHLRAVAQQAFRNKGFSKSWHAGRCFVQIGPNPAEVAPESISAEICPRIGTTSTNIGQVAPESGKLGPDMTHTHGPGIGSSVPELSRTSLHFPNCPGIDQRRPEVDKCDPKSVNLDQH